MARRYDRLQRVLADLQDLLPSLGRTADSTRPSLCWLLVQRQRDPRNSNDTNLATHNSCCNIASSHAHKEAQIPHQQREIDIFSPNAPSNRALS